MSNRLEVNFISVPPSPVSAMVPLDLRVGIKAPDSVGTDATFRIYRNEIREEALIRKGSITPDASTGTACYRTILDPGEVTGEARLLCVVELGGIAIQRELTIDVRPSANRSLGVIDGAFAGFYHWSEEEGRLWNPELARFGELDWRQLVQAQASLGMNILVPQESFRNQQYANNHDIETAGYHGRAFYPSNLFPGRMPIACADPMEVVLSEADRIGMHVLVPVGMYAWFDFSPGSLKWHLEVATELHARYGHHPSFWGWYLSEEMHGHIADSDAECAQTVEFLREFNRHCNLLAPGKPIMLASNCHFVGRAIAWYRELLPHLDILCPFAFHRMPEGDMDGAQAARTLQELCDEAGSHLWLDLEVFLFREDMALYPRPIGQIVEDLDRYRDFEKIICFQFPGLMNAPWANRKPGGECTVTLYNDYRLWRAQFAPATTGDALKASDLTISTLAPDHI